MKTFTTSRKRGRSNKLSFMSGLCFALVIDGINCVSLPPSDHPSLSPLVSLKSCKVDKKPVCEAWCSNHPSLWKDKCQWSNSCGGCSECGGCKAWCADNPVKWKDPNNEIKGNVKCNWIGTCASCPECSSTPKPTSSSTSTIATLVAPSPKPTQGCKSWCERHSAQWAQKCNWPINCGGCQQCVHPSTSNPTETKRPSSMPSQAPTATKHPSLAPSQAPTISKTKQPSSSPSQVPTNSTHQSLAPSRAPTKSPTRPAKGCMRWCKRHPAPWKSSNPSVRQKCKWPKNCGGCPQCK